MSKELAKSPEVLQKEAEIAALEKALKKKKTTLKSLKTRLKNTRQKIEDIQRDTQINIMNKMEDMDNLRIEIAGLAAELKNAKNMSEEDREQLGMMAEEMASQSLGEDFEEYKAQRERMQSGDFNFEEEFGERIRDIFGQFQVEPTEAEKKNIRKVFLNLSKKFHPDKAKSDEEALEYHAVMQKINEAYQNNDIETLLEMERLYLMEEPDFEGVAMADILQQKIDYLNREIAFIGNQAERVSEEIKSLRQSDMGQMLTHFDRAEREGEGLDEMAAHLEQGIELFTKLRDALKDSIKIGEISPKIHELLMEMGEIGMDDDPSVMSLQQMMADMTPEEMMEAFEEILGGDGDGPFSIFDDETPENAKFTVDSSVKIAKDFISNNDDILNMKGWEGRVQEVYHGEGERILYTIEFDSVTTNQMPEAYVKNMVEHEFDFQEADDVDEKYLEAAKPRDKQSDVTIAYRTHYHRYAWDYLGKEHAERLQKILLHKPELPDGQNWLIHLKKHLKLPIEVTSIGHVSPPGLPAKITKIEFSDPEAGVIVLIKRKGFKDADQYMLMDLMCSEKNKHRQLFEDYQEWADEFVDLDLVLNHR